MRVTKPDDSRSFDSRSVLLALAAIAGAVVVAGSAWPPTDPPTSSTAVVSYEHLDAPTNSGPRGAAHFCMAPPVPQRREPAPYPEFAPPIRERRFSPDEARHRFGASDTSRVLFILAEFADVPFDTSGIDTTGISQSTITYDRDTIIHDYFTRQMEFIREYYADVSYGRHVFDPVVHADIVSLPFPMAYYGDDDLFGERGTKMIWDAVAGADEAVDYADFDGISVIHAGPGQESDVNNDSKEQIWSAFFPQNLLSLVLTDSLGYSVPGIPTNDVTAEGDTVYVEGAAILPETETQDGFNFGLMGVTTHELGHVMLGWPDLYDTTGDSPSQGLGSFCLMAAGTWNANGNVPGEPSAWCRMYAGWAEPRLVDPMVGESEPVTLTYLEIDDPEPDDVLLARVPISGDEYFLVANQDPDHDNDETFDWVAADPENPLVNFWTDSYVGAEFDFFMPNEIPGSPVGTYKEPAGLSIWHIDESVVTFGFPFNIVNGDPRHHGIDLEEADGVPDLEFPAYTILSFGGPDDLFRAGEADTFGPTTTPNTAPTFGGSGTARIRDIGAPGPEVSFVVERVDGSGNGVSLDERFPISYPASISAAQPIVTDLGASTVAEILVLDDDGAVHVRSLDDAAPSWAPLTVAPPRGTPAVGAATAAGATDIVFADVDGNVHAVSTGNPLVLERSVFVHERLVGEGSLIDVDEDGRLEFVIGSSDAPDDSMAVPGRVHVVHLDDGAVESISVDRAPLGSIVGLGGGRVAVPLSFGGLSILGVGVTDPAEERLEPDIVFGPPTSGDLDRDGAIEIVAIGNDGRVYAFEDRGPFVTAWTEPIGGVPGSAVTLADLDDDGYLDICGLGTSGSVHVFNYNGVSKPGWPIVQDVAQDVFFDFTTASPGPLAADLDGDGRLELAPVFADGRVDVFDVSSSAATKIDRWSFQGGPGSVPVLGDFDGDGDGELFLLESVRDQFGADIFNRASVWNLGSSYRDRADAWTMYRGGPTGNPASDGAASGVRPQAELLADVYCQPNPAGPDGAWVHYRLAPNVDDVRVDIYDVAGERVRRLSGTRFGGVDNLVHWDGANDDGNVSSPGLYVYRVTARGGGEVQAVVGKMALVR